MSMVKKITLKTVTGGLSRKDTPEEGESVDLMTVIGQARRIEPASTDFGPYLRFKGAFEATDTRTGETFRSATLILPPVAQDILESAMGGESVGVEFALRISAVGDDSQIGFHYEADSLIEHEESDPLANIRNAVKKMLPAPDKETGTGEPDAGTGDAPADTAKKGGKGTAKK